MKIFSFDVKGSARKHLVIGIHKYFKKRVSWKGSVHIYIRRYLGGIPIERECFCECDGISRRRVDSYEWPGIVKPEKFHLLSVLRLFLRDATQWNPVNISFIGNTTDSGVYLISHVLWYSKILLFNIPMHFSNIYWIIKIHYSSYFIIWKITIKKSFCS